ncbi:murein hydrolase activator EnvC family protein [Ruminococcus sp.]|uniref:murein hydrolase activator EnvC family protein n=2 Tax=Ruminococcus sp. TaxID=41978 RepID=UPI003FD7269C
MNRLYSLKRILTFIIAFAVTAGIAGSSYNSSLKITSADAEYSQAEENTESAADEGQQEGEDQTSGEQTSSDDNSQQESSSTGFDITQYAEQLREISKKQQEINEQMDKYNDDIEENEKQQKLLKEKIDSVNDEIDVLNSYMTALELQINTNERNIAKKQEEIDKGIEDFKQRLRAMYIAGSDSYTTMLLESDSFYDILMRLELIKRVAHHDDTMIDNLTKLKTEYEDMQKDLDKQKTEYDAQYTQYTQQKEMLSQLYRSSTKTQQELKAKQKKLKEQNEAYEAERESFEGSLSGILKSSGSGGTARDNEVSATMALADVKLDELHKSISERLEKGEKLGEYEADYYFAWPVPGSYSVSSGVGARWGSYHSGLDIPAAHGTPIHASCSGKVIRINTTCTHDYGKESSCGCGGGYGNYVIIDHGNEFITLYGHLSEVDVEVGDEIKKGDVIGKMGSTGFSTGDHLHIEIRYQGYILNPAFYLDVTQS